MDSQIDKFKNSLAEFNIPIKDDCIDKLVSFYNYIIERNKVMNLTAITDFDEALDKHFMDSLSIFLVKDLLLSEGINILKDNRLIDIGAGAGIPGLPIKIYFPFLQVTLLDSLRKRIDFINECVSNLKLQDVKGIHARAEELARDDLHREKYDIAIARAVTTLPTLVEYALPFLKINGMFIAYKGPEVLKEIEESKRALDVLGGEVFHVKHYELPNLKDKRTLILIKKTKETSSKYPRRSGIPEKKPL